MKFFQFYRNIERIALGSDIQSHSVYYGHTIHEMIDNRILIDREESNANTVSEAIDFLRQNQLHDKIQQQIQHEMYSSISNDKLVSIIRRHHQNIQITDTLVESYIELASSKIFTTDPVAYDIRQYNKTDYVVEGHVDYILDDGSKVVISESIQNKINNIFNQHQDVIKYMRSSIDNLFSVVNQLED